MGMERNSTLEDLNALERSKYMPLTIILVVIMIIGIIGNTLVLIIYKTKFTRSSARCYILSLALADLSVCLFGIPYHVLDLTLILTYSYTNVCKGLSFFIGACSLNSVFILLVVGLDRYLKVCRPLKKQIRDFGDRKACLLAAFIAVVISVPNGIIYGHSSVQTSTYNLTGVECFIDDEFQGSELAVGYLGFHMLLYVLSVLFLIVIYGFIYRKIYTHDRMSGAITLTKTKKNCFCCTVKNQEEDEEADHDIDLKDVKDTNDISENEKARNDHQENEETVDKHIDKRGDNSTKKADRKVTVRTKCAMIRHKRPGSKAEEKNTRKITFMMMTITVVFIIAYFPFIIISIMDNKEEEFWTGIDISESLLLDLLLRFYLINNVANPIIYSFWDHRFRKEIMRLFKNIICCCRGDKAEAQACDKNMMPTTSSAYTKCTETMTVK